jgi:transposase-like protein
MPAESGASASVPSRPPVSDLEAENSRLRKELASGKLDIEILRQATAYFKRPYRVTMDSARSPPKAPNLLDRRFAGWQPH